jgi:hypothetical protein
MNRQRKIALLLILLSSLFFLTSCATPQWLPGYVPTPEMAIQFGPGKDKDPREWGVQNFTGNKSGFLAELVPAGDSLKSWKEMAAQQIAFIAQPLREYVEAWKQGLTSAEPNPTMKESTLEDGSILIEYQALQANEIGIRKFMQGPDGIYMMAYHVRPAFKRDDTYKAWQDGVIESKLLPNPERRRR